MEICPYPDNLFQYKNQCHNQSRGRRLIYFNSTTMRFVFIVLITIVSLLIISGTDFVSVSIAHVLQVLNNLSSNFRVHRHLGHAQLSNDVAMSRNHQKLMQRPARDINVTINLMVVD